jgi:hypothetical protein
MNTIGKAVQSLAVVALAILTVFFNNQIADNLLVFYTIVQILVVIALSQLHYDEAVRQKLRNAPAIQATISYIENGTVTVLMAGAGRFWMAAAWMVIWSLEVMLRKDISGEIKK